MKKYLKTVLTVVLLFAMTLNIYVFADDISPDEKAETYVLLTMEDSELGVGLVRNIQFNMNRYSPLAMSTSTDSGRGAYYVTSNTAATIQVTWEPETFLHRVMAQASFKSFKTLVPDFENNILRLKVAAGANFGKIIQDGSGRKNIKIGFSYTKNGGTFATDAKFVQLADYIDLDEMEANRLKYYEVEIPVKEILSSDDFHAFNGSEMTVLDPEAINGVTIAIDIAGGPNSMKIIYFTDVYLAYAPVMPKNIKYNVTSDSATLSWDYDTEEVSFNIFRDGEYIDTVKEKSYTDTALSPETEYFYQVQAVNGSTASKSAECSVTTNTFFSDPPLTVAGFKDICVNDNNDLKYIVPTSGDNVITGKLASDTYTGGAVVVAAAYKAGVLKNTDIDILSEVTSSGTDFSVNPSADDADKIKFFAVDSLKNLRLLSQIGEINQEGFSEKRIAEQNAPEDFSVDFVSDDSGFNVSAEGPDAYAVLALPEGKTPEDITKANAYELIAGIDVCGGKDEVPVKLIFDDEKFKDGYYSFYVSQSEKNPKEGYFATQKTIADIYADLNDKNVSSERVKECIESPVLNLDLSDYNRVAKDKAVSQFMSFKKEKIESVADIKEALDKAVGTVLFCSAVKKSDADLKKYASLIGFDENKVKKVTGELDTDDKGYLYKLLGEKSAEINTENAISLFENAYLCAAASSKSNTWKMLKEIVKDTVDYTLIPSGIDEAAVFKAMLNANYSEPEGIVKKYKAVIEELQGSKESDKKSSSSGGSSSGKKYYAVSDTGTVTTPDTASYVPQSGSGHLSLFKDLPETHWAYKNIISLLEQNILSKDENFRPNDKVKREEFAKMLVMIFKPVTDKKKAFSDVTENDWYYPYVNAAFSGGIAGGISETEFGSGMNISRQDMAKMLYNAIGVKKKAEEETEEAEEQNEEEKLAFEDADDISDYALEAVAFLSRHGILNGDENGNMNPKGNATRAECAAMLDRFLNNRNNIR